MILEAKFVVLYLHDEVLPQSHETATGWTETFLNGNFHNLDACQCDFSSCLF